MAKEKRLFVAQYYSQRDSKTGHAERMCFSSCAAMALKFLKPDSLKGSNADDDYLRVVHQNGGDTTLSGSQIRALAKFGIKATFSQRFTVEKLESEIDAGFPVAIGVLHRGHVSKPTGGGHWILVFGYTPTHFIVHDPYGEADVVNGGFVQGGSGRNQKYSRRNLIPRWEVEGPGTGWALTFRRIEQPKVELPIQRTFLNTWLGVRDAAQVAGAKFPDLVAAQWALESGWGKFPSGRHNYFGIKGKTGTTKQTKEFINGREVTITDTFKDFDSLYDCVEYLVNKWYKDYKNFKGVNNAPTILSAADRLVTEGYATDPRYAEKLKRLIKEHT